MKKKLSKIISAALAAALLCGVMSICAGASTKLSPKSISVHSGVKLYADGVEFVPADSEGVPVEVFLYNGTTYLPVRAISGLFNVGIEWESETESVYLATHGGKELESMPVKANASASPFAFEAKNINVHTGVSLYYKDEYFVPTDSEGVTVDTFLYNGTTYLPVRAVSKLLNAEIDWEQETKSVLITLPGSGAEKDGGALVKKILDSANLYTDSSPLFLSYYQYYLKVSTVLEQNLGLVREAYLADTSNAELYMQYLEVFTPYQAFTNQFGTYSEKCSSLTSFARDISSRLSKYDASHVYTAEELETLEANLSYLETNQALFREYIIEMSNEKILLFVKENFSAGILSQVGEIEFTI